MKNILAIGASSSRKSINKIFANYAASQVEGAAVNLVDLNDYEMTIYSIDKERESGIPEKAYKFKEAIKDADGIVISFAEHNGTYTAAFKNIMDWVSRINRGMWENKPMLLLAAAPGSRGGITALEIAVKKFQFMGAKSINSFSLPFFSQNFLEEHGITDPDLAEKFMNEIREFNESVKQEIMVKA